MGVLQTNEASRVRSSKDCSGSGSRMAYFSRATMRATSLSGLVMTISHLLRSSRVTRATWPGAESYSKSREVGVKDGELVGKPGNPQMGKQRCRMDSENGGVS